MRAADRDSAGDSAWHVDRVGGPGVLALAALFIVLAVAGLVAYQPALRGGFISDDHHYVEANPYVHDPNFENLIAMWNPTSVVAILVENYAPVHLMLHAAEWQLFGPEVLGYHVVNVLCHALAATLLVAVFRRSGIATAGAVLGAAIFLLHPANVESVAWISQLKSSSALVLALAALLAHPKRPALATLFFTLALFAKPFAAFALIVVALFGWLRTTGDGAKGQRTDFRWPWLAAWLLIVIAFALMEASAFSRSAGLAPPLYPDLLDRYRTIFSIALRYLLMAGSGWGLSTFHEPPAVKSFLDPWLLATLVALGLLGWRLVVCLRRRSEEAVYWLWAVVSFAPLCGVVPLPYPMADRYLYFILPGLIGAVLLASVEVAERLGGLLGGGDVRIRQLRGAELTLAGLLLFHFASATHARAYVFRSVDSFMADTERHYPDGAAAATRKASRAAREGDFPAAVQYVRAAQARGYNRLDHILQDPALSAMQGYPEFDVIMVEMANEWLERLTPNPRPSQIELRAIAQAHIVLDDLPTALLTIERGLELPGPISAKLEADVVMLKRQISLNERLAAEKARRQR